MVRQLPEKLQLEEFYQWLDQGEGHEEGSSSLRQSAKTTVSRLLESADDDFDNKVRQIVDDISSKVSGWFLAWYVQQNPSTMTNLDVWNSEKFGILKSGLFLYSIFMSKVLKVPLYETFVILRSYCNYKEL